ncbi:retrotransposon protein, putative, ty1-copia subclass [Tanacetum coccineum]
MHNMGKTIGELHALLIEYEKDLPKKAATLQVMAIQSGRIHKANKKSLNAKGKGKGKGNGKDKTYIPKPKNPKPYAKEHPTKDDACHHYKEVGHWKSNCPVYLVELIKKKKQVGTTNLGCEALVKRDTLDKLQQRSIKCIFIGYPMETIGYYFYFLPENKIVVARYAEFLEKNLISQKVSRRAEELKEIQDKDTSPSENTSEIPIKVEEVEEHSLGDLNDPNNYKAAILDPKSNKWVDVMNAEMQSMKDNQVWCLVDLPPNYMFLVYDGNHEAELRVDCYCYAIFDTNKDDIKSQTGYVFVLNGVMMDWKSSKQSTTAMSATYAEYICLLRSQGLVLYQQ